MNYSEFSLINHIKSRFADLTPPDIIGIGDDCAVIPYSKDQHLVITTDMLVERVHFLRDKISPYELGRKSVAVNLSDIAAMGAKPIAITLSIALTNDVQNIYIEQFTDGVRSLNIPLIGGDTTSSKSDITISVTALGLADRQNIKLRSAAQPGDVIYVTGNLGDSAAGLHALLHNISSPDLIHAHHNPTPRLEQGFSLGRISKVHAMMDISDGIASDLRHILQASGVSAVIDTSKVPLSDALIKFCKSLKLNPLHFALEGGEDYELLFTASPDAIISAHPCYPIGVITAGNAGGITWVPEGDYSGFKHF